MHCDVAIIGAGMSGLAAGIRLAHFEKKVCIFERHYAYGGLNSYYRLGGREFDVGLHAVTNFCSPADRSAPLNKLLRQLRITREELGLLPHRFSEVRFPGHRFRFTNDPALLHEDIAAAFPREIDGFRRLFRDMHAYDFTRLDTARRSARAELAGYIRDPVLTDMLLCPIMFYGSAEPHDMDFMQFAILFRSLFCEGFARPREGVRRIIRVLVKKYRGCGGQLRMRAGVDRLLVDGDRVVGLRLDDGETVTADTVLSSAGYVETLRMLSTSSSCESSASEAGGNGATADRDDADLGRISFVETIAVTDELPHRHGHEAAVMFYCDDEQFRYQTPDADVDPTSGVVCCPSNYEGHDDMVEGFFRVTWLANPGRWMSAPDDAYWAMKRDCETEFRRRMDALVPGLTPRIVAIDSFTPRTIHRFTGHLNGAVYGSPRKRRDGRTALRNLFICGTDQGYLGIIGAMLSGITIANLHVLSEA